MSPKSEKDSISGKSGQEFRLFHPGGWYGGTLSEFRKRAVIHFPRIYPCMARAGRIDISGRKMCVSNLTKRPIWIIITEMIDVMMISTSEVIDRACVAAAGVVEYNPDQPDNLFQSTEPVGPH